MTRVEMTRCDFCERLGEDWAELVVPFAMVPPGVALAEELGGGAGVMPLEPIALHVCDGQCRGIVSTALKVIADARREGRGVHYQVTDVQVTV